MVSCGAVLFSDKGTALTASTDLMVASGNTADPGSDLFIRMVTGTSTLTTLGQVSTPLLTTSAGIGL